MTNSPNTTSAGELREAVAREVERVIRALEVPNPYYNGTVMEGTVTGSHGDARRAAVDLIRRLAALRPPARAGQGEAVAWRNLGWFSGLARKHGYHAQADWLDTQPSGEADRLREALRKIIEIRQNMTGTPIDTEAANAWGLALDLAADEANQALAASAGEEG